MVFVACSSSMESYPGLDFSEGIQLHTHTSMTLTDIFKFHSRVKTGDLDIEFSSLE